MKTQTTIFASFLLLTAPAFAQMVNVDINEDGMVSFDELVAVYKNVTEEQFAEMDTNRDGSLDEDELNVAIDAGILVKSE